MVFKRNARRRSIRKRRTFRKKKTTVSPRIKSYVNRVIRRSEETKFASQQYALANFNSGINSSADLISLLPQISNGSGQNARIGTKIRPVRMEITGYVVYQTGAVGGANLGNNDARMLGARLFVYQDKATKSYTNNIYNYQLLDLGGTSIDFTGTALNWVSPHNKDQFTFFADRKMKIFKPHGLTNLTTTSASHALTSMDASMFHPFRIVLTQKQLPAVLHFDENDSAVYPTNFSPYIALGYCDLLNNSPDTISSQIAMEFVCTLYYKDA